MATQLQRYLVLSAPFAALWILMFAGIIELPQRDFLLYYLPCIAVFLFGLYALYSVINGATNISDCEAAKEELLHEMKETQAELKKHGVIEQKEPAKESAKKNE